MKEEKAISNLAVFVLINKRDVISLINKLGIASLPYDTSISIVNEIVINNANTLESGLIKMALNQKDEEYSSFEPISTTAWIIATIIISVTATGLVVNSNEAKRQREEIFRLGYTKRYIDKETLKEVAFINRKEMQKQFLIAQQDYLQQEENMTQQNRKDKRFNIAFILVGGIMTVLLASKLLKG